MNFKAHQQLGDPSWEYILAFQRAELIRKITLKYNQCLRLVRYAANSNHRWALPEALLRIPVASGAFYVRLSLEDLTAAAAYYSASGLEVCKLVDWICTQTGNEGPLIGAVTAAVMLTRNLFGEHVEWARRLIEGIKDDDIKTRAQYLLDRNLKRLAGELPEGDIDASLRQIVENMATSLGIAISDPNDPTAKLVQIGIKDANPGRVLKNCEHIFTSLGPNPPLSLTGMLAHTLRLPSVGPKIIHCTFHDVYELGSSLDPTYEKFKSQYCDNCSYSKPRPAGWNYSEEWQQEENFKHSKFMEDFYRKARRTC